MKPSVRDIQYRITSQRLSGGYASSDFSGRKDCFLDRISGAVQYILKDVSCHGPMPSGNTKCLKML